MISSKWRKTSIWINFLPPPLSHKFSNKRKKKISIHADHHINTTDLYIKSINVVRHSLLSVNTLARLKKVLQAHCFTLGFFFLATISACAFSCSFELVSPSIDSHNPHLLHSTEWRKCAYMVMRGSLKCHCVFAITSTPQTGSQARVWLLVYFDAKLN